MIQYGNNQNLLSVMEIAISIFKNKNGSLSAVINQYDKLTDAIKFKKDTTELLKGVNVKGIELQDIVLYKLIG